MLGGFIMNYLRFGLAKAIENPQRWKVIEGLYKEKNLSNVIRNAGKGYYPEVLRTVNKSGNVLGTLRSYRNAEISTNGNGVYNIAHTCNPRGEVEQVQLRVKSLSQLRAYWKEMSSKFSEELYRPIR